MIHKDILVVWENAIGLSTESFYEPLRRMYGILSIVKTLLDREIKFGATIKLQLECAVSGKHCCEYG